MRCGDELGGLLTDRSGFRSLLDGSQHLFAWLEESNLLRADDNLLAGPWIARYAAAALTGGKGPEPPDFHSAALTHCLEDAFKDSLYDSSPFST